MSTCKISVKIEDIKPEVKSEDKSEDILSTFKELPASDNLYNYFIDDIQIYDTSGVSQMKLLKCFKKLGKQLDVESNIFNPYISNYLRAVGGTATGITYGKVKYPNYLIIGKYAAFLLSTINKNWIQTDIGDQYRMFFQYKDGYLTLLH